MKQCKDCVEYRHDGGNYYCERRLHTLGQWGLIRAKKCAFYARKPWMGWLWLVALIIILTLALLLGGCGVDVSYKDELGREFRYRRIGPQQIGEVLLELPDGSTFLMDGQKSEMPPVKITLPQGIIIESGGKAVKP